MKQLKFIGGQICKLNDLRILETFATTISQKITCLANGNGMMVE
jgi:hypothetical protein